MAFACFKKVSCKVQVCAEFKKIKHFKQNSKYTKTTDGDKKDINPYDLCVISNFESLGKCYHREQIT